MEGKTLLVDEKVRTYTYPDGSQVRLEDVVEVITRPSGTHRVTTANKHLHIIVAGWIHIEIDDGGLGWVY